MSAPNRGSREHGLTVVELMVTLTVLSIVLTGLTAGAVSILRATSHINLHTIDQNEARIAIEVLSRDVRAAAPVRPSPDPAFLVATPNEAIFTANLDDTTRPLLVRFRLDADRRLIEDATPPQVSASPNDPLTWDVDNDAVVRYIAAYVVNDDTLPLFRFFDAAGTELPLATEECDGPGGTTVPAPCLDLDERRRIALVAINLTVSSDPGDRVGSFTVSQRVRLPNA